MRAVLSAKSVLLIAFSVIAALCICRLATAHFDASYFITAGSDFVDKTETRTPIAVQAGQGYDGQFFYRYALNPFDLGSNKYGVTVDHPGYRAQRIGYPVLTYLLSFGGTPVLVPWAMILINILAFVGIFFFTDRLIAHLQVNTRYTLLPLLLFGLYMSVSRDLAEVTELCFFTGCIYALQRGRGALFAIFATLTILCRETSLIALLPVSICLFLARKRENGIPLAYIAVPFLVFAAWKGFLYTQLPSLGESAAGYHSLGIPFKGLVDGFLANADFSSSKNTWQFIFWTAYILWTAILVAKVLPTISMAVIKKLDTIAMLQVIYLTWLIFAVSFSSIIYVDDWGFMRVFSMWNLVGMLILVASGRNLGKVFIGYSCILLLLTLIRLVINV
jgi:hypothetical protein